jgi:hypothetical protein
MNGDIAIEAPQHPIELTFCKIIRALGVDTPNELVTLGIIEAH